MKITNCNTMEKVVCGCTLSFSSYVASSASVLDVGNLLGGSCTLTSYVIDWYRNANKELVSGTNGAAPDIQAVHPFTGTGAIPVPGGTWVPVIRWVVIAGVKYYSEPAKCKKWCATLTGLPTITVSSLNCGSTGGTPATYYQYKLAYVSTQDYSYATRKILWYLGADTKYFAFLFSGYTVADKISIFKNEETSPLTSWIVGSNSNSNNVATMPYRSTGAVRQVLVMGAFTTGDYLRIEITPSVLESNINTNWDLNVKCLQADSNFDAECALMDTMKPTLPNINTFSWTDQMATNCRHLFNVTMNTPIKPLTDFPLLNRYCGLGLANFGVLVTNQYTTGQINYIFTRSSSGNGQYCGSAPQNCIAASGTVTVTKVGSSFLIACTHITDYNAFKTQWDAQVAQSCWTSWVNDPTVLAYYRFFHFNHRLAAACGDSSQPVLTLTGHRTSTWVWDPVAMTCTFTPATVTNQIPAAVCDSSPTSPNTSISACNTTIALLATDSRLRASTTRSIGWGSSQNTKYDSFMMVASGGVYYYAPALAMPCAPAFMPISSTERRLYPIFFQITITNDTDRANNYEVKSYMNFSTDLYQSPPILIYKIVNGVQTFPVI